MAEIALVKDDLSRDMIRAGRRLTDVLLKRGMDVVGSFWLYRPESNSWRLVIASPEVSERGPRVVYEKIQAALSEQGARLSGLRLDRVSAVSEQDPTYRALSGSDGFPPARTDDRLTREVVNRRYIEDAWVYRIT